MWIWVFMSLDVREVSHFELICMAGAECVCVCRTLQLLQPWAKMRLIQGQRLFPALKETWSSCPRNKAVKRTNFIHLRPSGRPEPRSDRRKMRFEIGYGEWKEKVWVCWSFCHIWLWASVVARLVQQRCGLLSLIIHTGDCCANIEHGHFEM